MEPALGWIEGAGGVQHLTRLMGRGRALEVLMSGQDYDADLAERYGWVNRALPLAELDGFVNALAHIANTEDHHPDLSVGYNYCHVTFSTHSIGGLSENDFICAAKLDRL